LRVRISSSKLKLAEQVVGFGYDDLAASRRFHLHMRWMGIHAKTNGIASADVDESASSRGEDLFDKRLVFAD
jgi:hypothetical protein